MAALYQRNYSEQQRMNTAMMNTILFALGAHALDVVNLLVKQVRVQINHVCIVLLVVYCFCCISSPMYVKYYIG
jgi:hypothetical protein